MLKHYVATESDVSDNNTKRNIERKHHETKQSRCRLHQKQVVMFKQAYNEMKVVILVILFAITCWKTSASPIQPLTLRRLIELSDYVVVARIDNPDTSKFHYNPEIGDSVKRYLFGGDGLADLYISEVVIGSCIIPHHIQVSYQAGVMCPSPPHYPDKEIVLAFLRKEDTSTTYQTVGLSYGTEIINSENELIIYKQRIAEYLDIQKIVDENVKQKETLEWVVKCAESIYTRFSGVYELMKDREYWINSADSIESIEYRKLLTTAQKERLANIFFSREYLGYSELAMMEFISDSNDKRKKEHLVKSLLCSDYYNQEQIMNKIVELSPNESLQELITRIDKIDYDDEYMYEKRNILIDRFKELVVAEYTN